MSCFMSNFIKEFQEYYNKTDEDMAALLEVSRPTYLKIRSGGRQLSLAEFQSLASLTSAPSDDTLVKIFGLFSKYSPKEIDSILETMLDMGLLSEKGKAVRHILWLSCVKE